MSASQFTPGPWVTGVWEGAVSGRNQHYGRHAAVFAPSGDMVAPCGLPDDPENIPNARLIAAAPELYEALTDIMENPLFQTAIGGNPNMVEALMARANSALAKARGETPIQEDTGTAQKAPVTDNEQP